MAIVDYFAVVFLLQGAVRTHPGFEFDICSETTNMTNKLPRGLTYMDNLELDTSLKILYLT